MARGFGMTALRAALGGVAGYGQDVAARREREKLDAEMARQQERQAAMDQVMLQDKGYLSMGQQERAKQTGGAAVLRAALMGARDQGAIDQGLSAAAPQQTLTLGGQQFTRESPVAAAARAASRSMYEKQQEDKRTKAEKQSTIDEQVKALMATGDYTEAQARAAVVGGVGAYTPLTKAQRADIALRGRQISLAERQAAMAGQQGAGGQAPSRKAGATDKMSLQATLPNVIAYAESFAKMTPEQVRKMSPDRMDARSTAMATEGLGGLALRYGQSKIKQTRLTPAEERYIAMSNAVADAVSRATDIGVQSNFDVKRFRDQVKPLAGDSPEEMEAKLRVVKQWANWLISHKKTIEEYDAAYEAGRPLPTITLQGPTELDGVSEEEATGSPAATQGMAAPRAPSAAPAAIPGVAPLRTQVRPMGTQVRPVSSAPSAGRSLPPGVDAEKYRTDPAYRAFVDRGSR